MSEDSEIEAYFEKELGWVPESMRLMITYTPDAAKALLEFRRALMKDPPLGALPRKFKEILFVVLDAVVGNVEGGKAHARAAVKAGVSAREITEALGLAVYLTGLPTMERAGTEILKAAIEAAQ